MSSSEASVHRKSWAGAPSGFYAVEAAGLRWLAEATPHGGARVAEVMAAAEDHIDLTTLEPSRPTPEAETCRSWFTPLEDSSPARLVDDVYDLRRWTVEDEAGTPVDSIGVYVVDRSGSGRSTPPAVEPVGASRS